MEIKARVYDVPEVAKIFKISRSYAYKKVADGTIPSLRIGDRVVIPAAAVEKLLESAGSCKNA